MGNEDPNDFAELLMHESYTPEELAELIGRPVDMIRQLALDGVIPAEILEHHVLLIRREDAIAWLAGE